MLLVHLPHVEAAHHFFQANLHPTLLQNLWYFIRQSLTVEAMWQALAHCAIFLMLFISLIRTCTGASTQEPSALDRRKALSGATLWIGQPNAWDIEQDWRGDCWLVGVLSSIAYADPKKLKSIIQGNAENGHVGVTLMKKTGPKKFVVTEELMKKNHRLDSDSHKGNQVEWYDTSHMKCFVQNTR